MKYILTPHLTAADADIAPERFQGQPTVTEMSGFFYDYLRDESGHVVGVRYWGMSDRAVLSGALLCYANDPRFLFHSDENFVDIVFFAAAIPSLIQGALTVDTVQEFGGEGMFDLSGERALVFDISSD